MRHPNSPWLQSRRAFGIMLAMSDESRSSHRGFAIVILTMAALIAAAWALRLDRPIMRRDAPLHDPPWPDMRIDINRADAAEFTLLPGIGPALAHRIVEDRDEHGTFESLDDLARVRLIGPVIVERIEPYVILGRTHVAEARH